MATRTTHYGLIKPDLKERADVRIINSNMDIIDNLVYNIDVDTPISKHNESNNAHADIRASVSSVKSNLDQHKTDPSAHKAQFDAVILPTGIIVPFCGNGTIPTGYLVCDGSTVSRVTYARLFSVIGTTYGVGDGQTTFGLPNMIDRVVQGNNGVATYLSAGLPNITGEIPLARTGQGWEPSAPQGALYQKEKWNASIRSGGSDDWGTIVGLDASKSNPIYGRSNTVQPNALAIRYLIKC